MLPKPLSREGSAALGAEGGLEETEPPPAAPPPAPPTLASEAETGLESADVGRESDEDEGLEAPPAADEETPPPYEAAAE